MVRNDMELHVDRSAWTCVLYLNNVEGGGELDFPSLGVSIKPRAGFAAIFPGGSHYPHRSLPIKSGEKYALVIMAEKNGAVDDL